MKEVKVVLEAKVPKEFVHNTLEEYALWAVGYRRPTVEKAELFEDRVAFTLNGEAGEILSALEDFARYGEVRLARLFEFWSSCKKIEYSPYEVGKLLSVLGWPWQKLVGALEDEIIYL